MRPLTLLLTIFVAVAGAQGETPGTAMGKGEDVNNNPKNNDMTKPEDPKDPKDPKAPNDGSVTTLPNGSGAGGRPDDGSTQGRPYDGSAQGRPYGDNGRGRPDDGGRPPRGGAGSLAPTLLFTISAAGLAALVV